MHNLKIAFGSFFKKTISGAKNVIGKVVPIVKKGLNAVSEIAPAIATGAAALSGAIGATIGSVASTVRNIAGGLSNFRDKAQGATDGVLPPKLLGAKPQSGANGVLWAGINPLPVNGANRFVFPLLK